MADGHAPFSARPEDQAANLPDWPVFGLDADMRPFLARARADGEAAALVTLVKAEGGGPRRPGAQMAVTKDDVSGFLSGGCVEADIVCHARACLADGRPRTLVYGDGSPFFDIRLLCGRCIEVRIERLMPDDVAVGRLLDLTARRLNALWISDGIVRLCEPGHDNREIIETRDNVLLKLYRPHLRFTIVGRDPAVLAMATLASQSGLETTIVRVNGPAVPPPLANIGYCRSPIDENLDPRTAVVVAQHDFDADHAAVITALRSPAAYVGLMGARRQIDAHLAKLETEGLSDERLSALKAPVGLPLGSHTPWEIAVSVIGEVMQHFNAQHHRA